MIIRTVLAYVLLHLLLSILLGTEVSARKHSMRKFNAGLAARFKGRNAEKASVAKATGKPSDEEGVERTEDGGYVPSEAAMADTEEDEVDEVVGTVGRPGIISSDVVVEKEAEITKPPDYEKIVEDAKKYQNKMENVTEEDEVNVKSRAGLADTYYRWPYEMKIQIDPSFTKKQRHEINSAIWTLRAEMKCFKFIVVDHRVTLPKKLDHLYIKWKKSSSACNSGMGRWPGKTVMTITNSCIYLYGTAMHEMMHTLGFFHEQNRPDRDKYVTIDWTKLNTDAKKKAWLIPKGDQKQELFAKNYDFDSILHYPFSHILKPKVKVPNGIIVGQRSHLSATDKMRLLKMYPCDKNNKPAKLIKN